MTHQLFVVSHTHWDREWYLPFQLFRLKLVRLVDRLLQILAEDPDYRYFTLDGQAIVLEDYLEVRPERGAEIRAHVQSGRLLIGPWYVLPDEFLVSPEALVRNLLLGRRICQRFGPAMPVGYVPDTFGHISQLPQLMRGFGMDTAAFRRGLSDEPTELLWSAPDGSTVLVCYLRDGYDNAAWLPREPQAFVETVQRLRESLAPHATTPNLLLMNGTDHMEPMPELPALIRYANKRLDGAQLVHSTLPQYIEAVKESLVRGPESKVGIHSQEQLPTSDFPCPSGQDGGPGTLDLGPGTSDLGLRTIRGELRSPKRHHVVSGVLSTRTWIKQRNAVCQTLLEAWAEPFTAFCRLVNWDKRTSDFPCPSGQDGGPRTSDYSLRLAWRYLLQNHPHDSICGCSVDQVHREMVTRFDWVEQIGEEVTRQSLDAIAGQVNTEDPDGLAAIVVFNPLAGPRNDVVDVALQVPAGVGRLTLVDEHGQPALFQVQAHRPGRLVASLDLDPQGLAQAMNVARYGRIFDMVIRDIRLRRDGELVHLDVTLIPEGEGKPDMAALERTRQAIRQLIEVEGVTQFRIQAQTVPTVQLTVVARDVPGFGYKTCWVREGASGQTSAVRAAESRWDSIGAESRWDSIGAESRWDSIGDCTDCGRLASPRLENEFYRVEVDPADGTLALTDKTTGAVFRGLNRFVDGGDRGDEYNYDRPADDLLVTGPAAPPVIEWVEQGPARQTLRVSMLYRLPESLEPDRARRSTRLVEVPIVSEVSLSPGVRRVDVRTTVDNQARDHRLRAHFPTPMLTDQAWAEGHWDVIARPVTPVEASPDWVEAPAPTKPQRAFVDLSDGRVGLLVANRGLPEYEVIPGPAGQAVALTLLRCVGWLSRGDLSARQGHAGPALETPEAQCLGQQAFEYALVAHAGDWRNALREAHAFNAPMRAVGGDPRPGRLPAETSFLEVAPADLVVSAVKLAEEGDGLVVRCYNLGPEVVTARLRPFVRPSAAHLARLDEVPLEELPIGPEGAVEVDVRSRQVVTVIFSCSPAR